eukprot:402543-Amphidinium_carterae.3
MQELQQNTRVTESHHDFIGLVQRAARVFSVLQHFERQWTHTHDLFHVYYSQVAKNFQSYAPGLGVKAGVAESSSRAVGAARDAQLSSPLPQEVPKQGQQQLRDSASACHKLCDDAAKAKELMPPSTKSRVWQPKNGAMRDQGQHSWQYASLFLWVAPPILLYGNLMMGGLRRTCKTGCKACH